MLPPTRNRKITTFCHTIAGVLPSLYYKSIAASLPLQWQPKKQLNVYLARCTLFAQQNQIIGPQRVRTTKENEKKAQLYTAFLRKNERKKETQTTMDAPADPPAFLPPRYPGEDFLPGQFRDAYPSSTPSEPEEYYSAADESRLNASLIEEDQATTIPSLEQEGGHSLPTPDEARNANFLENNPYSGRRKRMWALMGLGLVVLTVIIAMSVAIPKQKENKSLTGSSSSLDGVGSGNGDADAGTGNPDTTDPLREPGSTVQVNVSRYAQVAEYFTSRGITSPASFSNKEGPQHMAAMWIADYDPLQLPLPTSGNYEFEQRYVLATFYYALDGPNWHSDLKFLSGAPVCEWNMPFALTNELGKQSNWDMGVTCGDTGNAEILFIGTYCSSLFCTHGFDLLACVLPHSCCSLIRISFLDP